MDDREIIRLFFERSDRAIDELLKKYGAACFKVAFNILNDRQDAEECVNDACLAVWNKVPPERPDPLMSYLISITRNLALKKYRSNTAKKRGSVYDISLDELSDCFPSGMSVEGEAEANETAELINRFLLTLEPESRILFVRRYWFADSLGDLSTLFGKSEHYISVRLHRIRKALAKYLEKEGRLL